MMDNQGSKEVPSELCRDLTELSISTGISSSHEMASSDTDEPLGFMDLPAEIRNKVYEHTLTNPDGRFFIGSKYSAVVCHSRAVLSHKLRPYLRLSDYPAEYAASTRNLAILRTSKAVYGEAGMILYGQKLIFHELVALHSFLIGLRQPQISLLRHVTVDGDGGIYKAQRDIAPRIFALLSSATSLETLCIPGVYLVEPFRKSIGGDHDAADGTMSLACWDSVVVRKLAADLYSFAFTYLRVAVPARGIDKVMDILRPFNKIFWLAPAHAWFEFRPDHVGGAKWTEERNVALKKVMGQEIVRLLEADKD